MWGGITYEYRNNQKPRKFFGGGTKVPHSLIPTMTSDTTPSGCVASASSVYSSSYSAWRAFDGSLDASSYWCSAEGQKTAYVQIELQNAVKAKYCKIKPRTATGIDVFGSNDGSTFVLIGQQIFDTNNIDYVFALNNSNAYKYYRFTCQGSTSTFNAIFEIQLYDADTRIHLYKDGTQNVAWDNSGVYRATTAKTASGGVTFNEFNFAIEVPSNEQSKALLSNNPINVDGYSKLKAIYGTSVLEVDLTNVSVGYVFVHTTRSNGTGYMQLGISATKDLFSTNAFAKAEVSSVNGTYFYTRVWLEK